MTPRNVLITLLVLLFAPLARAHELRPAYLVLRETTENHFDGSWKVPARDNRRLGLYVRLPDDCVVVRELSGAFVDDAYVERWSFTHPAGLVDATIRIDGLRETLTDVLVRIERLDGSTQVERLSPERPEVVVRGALTKLQVAGTYTDLGVRHILGGVDHLLFVLGLLFLVRGRAMLFKTITAFTVAHSIALAIATFGYVNVPPALVNTLVALSILFLGPELVREQRGETSLTIERPWLVAFAFGLLHGLGFASGLTQLGLPHSEVPLALLSFNVGVELGQLGFVAVLLALGVALGELQVRFGPRMRRLPAYVVGSLGAFWLCVGLSALI
ncbi:MAG: HupE/UreJ family protein [Planctomycetes bacterium]|nr:HupE/UreJ family protein [Planctomycetota bacterium]MCB9903032.1 HupE/UreJ family protein [Planctomycetota bacterium]